jgi:hypothetical protein
MSAKIFLMGSVYTVLPFQSAGHDIVGLDVSSANGRRR